MPPRTFEVSARVPYFMAAPIPPGMVVLSMDSVTVEQEREPMGFDGASARRWRSSQATIVASSGDGARIELIADRFDPRVVPEEILRAWRELGHPPIVVERRVLRNAPFASAGGSVPLASDYKGGVWGIFPAADSPAARRVREERGAWAAVMHRVPIAVGAWVRSTTFPDVV